MADFMLIQSVGNAMADIRGEKRLWQKQIQSEQIHLLANVADLRSIIYKL